MHEVKIGELTLTVETEEEKEVAESIVRSYEDLGEPLSSVDYLKIKNIVELSLLKMKFSDDPAVVKKLDDAIRQNEEQLSVTRKQRQRTRSTRTVEEILQSYVEKAAKFAEEHLDEFVWTCAHCQGVNLLEVPHFAFESRHSKLVWVPQTLPLIRRFYDREYRRQDSKHHGGLSIEDAAKIWGVSPLGVLLSIWEHSYEGTKEEGRPRLRELCGFEFDPNRPETMEKYVGGYYNTQEFWREMDEFFRAERRKEEARKLRREHPEVIFMAVLSDPVLFSDFFGPTMLGIPNWKLLPAQIPPMASREQLPNGRPFRTPIAVWKVVEVDGRSTGKSRRIVLRAWWSAIYCLMRNWGNEGVVATQRKIHIARIMEWILQAAKWEPFLQLFLPVKRMQDESVVSRNLPSGYMRLWGGKFTIYFTYAGETDKSAGNVHGFHAVSWIVDEFGFWSKAAHTASRRSIHSNCIQEAYFGVSVDERMDYPVYYMQQDESWRPYTYNLPSWINVFDYSLKAHRDMLEEGGGDVNSPSFMRLVRGKAWTPSNSLFPYNNIKQVCSAEYPYRLIAVTDALWRQVDDHYRLLTMRMEGVEQRYSKIAFGMDYGYEAPTVICGFGLLKQADVWELFLRVVVKRLRPYDQFELLKILDRRWQPEVIAIDATGTHNPILTLAEQDLELPVDKFFPVKFGKTYPRRVYFEQPSDWRADKLVKVTIHGATVLADMRPATDLAAELMYQALIDGKIVLPATDVDLIEELRLLKREGGKIVGVDHTYQAISTFLIWEHWQRAILGEIGIKVQQSKTSHKPIEPVIINMPFSIKRREPLVTIY